jgi:hypothetical protein
MLKVWTAGPDHRQEKTHVSERKFIEDENAEELIKPNAGTESSHNQEVMI